MPDIRFLMTLGWVNQLMAWVDHTKYFWPEMDQNKNYYYLPTFMGYLQEAAWLIG